MVIVEGQARGLNTTNCLGGEFGTYLPVTAVAPHVPPKYGIGKLGGQFAHVMLQVLVCAQTSVDGVNVGPAGFQFVTIDVTSAEGTTIPPEFYPRYLAEVRTNNSQVASWLEKQGVRVAAGTVARSWTTLPTPGYSELNGKVFEGTRIVYEFSGVTSRMMTTRPFPERQFFGPDPTKDFLDQNMSIETSGSWEAHVSMEAGSRFSEISGGATKAAGLCNVFNVFDRNFAPAPGKA